MKTNQLKFFAMVSNRNCNKSDESLFPRISKSYDLSHGHGWKQSLNYGFLEEEKLSCSDPVLNPPPSHDDNLQAFDFRFVIGYIHFTSSKVGL